MLMTDPLGENSWFTPSYESFAVVHSGFHSSILTLSRASSRHANCSSIIRSDVPFAFITSALPAVCALQQHDGRRLMHSTIINDDNGTVMHICKTSSGLGALCELKEENQPGLMKCRERREIKITLWTEN